MITVVPSRNMAVLNWLINHPEIAPHVRDDTMLEGQIDMVPLNHYANIFLQVDSDGEPAGFAAMLARGFGIYEQHSGMLAAFRGHNALRAGRDVAKWMFLNSDCETVTTWAWSSAKHVMMMARAVGFVEEARTRWPNKVKGESVDRVTYSMTLAEWARKTRDDFVEESAKLNLSVEPSMIGLDAIFVRMALSNHIDKAQRFYNRWAAIFGAQSCQVIASRGGSIVFCIGARIYEVAPDLTAVLIQGDSLCHSQPQQPQH